MSACISSQGEYGMHILDDAHTCTRCGVLDEDALVAELRHIRAELGRVQEAYDRAKPVLDAARAWRKDVYEEPAFGEDSGEWVHVAEDALAAAVDAYDTAQKAPHSSWLHFGGEEDELDKYAKKLRLHEQCVICGGQLPMWECELLQRAPETALESTLSHEPAEVDHPDADTTEPPAWLTEAYTAAGLAMVRVDPDDDEADYYEWHECDDQPNCNVVSRGEPCPCSGKPWPSAVVRAALDAAAPIIRRAAEQERDDEYELRKAAELRRDDVMRRLLEVRAERDREKGLRVYADHWAAQHAEGEHEARAEADALRAQLADAKQERDRALALLMEREAETEEPEPVKYTAEEMAEITAEVAEHPRRHVIEAIAETTYELHNEEGGGGGMAYHLEQAYALVDATPGLSYDEVCDEPGCGAHPPTISELHALRAQLADAERDALNRAADELEQTKKGWFGGWMPVFAGWLRERAKGGSE